MPHTLRIAIFVSAAFLVECYSQQCDPDDSSSSQCVQGAPGDNGGDLFLLQTDLIVNQKSIAAEEKALHVAASHQKLEERNSHTTPRTFYHYTVLPLLIITAVVAWFTQPKMDNSADESAFNEPRFRSHRYRFLLVWGICASADWLQGPYVYALYDSFGYDKTAINKLFVIGFASSMVFGTFVGSLADTWGRKRTALLYCVLYIISCGVVHCSWFPVLVLGRVTGGVATSLLFSTFECWMVGEHNERHQFSAALLRYMFSMMYFVNYLVAILAGLVGQTAVEALPLRRVEGYQSLHYGGNTCAYDIAIAMLCLAFPLICFTWSENYGDAESQQTTLESYKAACRAFTSSWKVGVVGIIIACFEGSMYAFVINWTPTLTIDGAPSPPHGLIFSTMMMCCMMGSSIFSFFNPKVNPAKVVLLACVISSCCFAFVALESSKPTFVCSIYFMFLCFEACVGLYFPSVGSLKSELVPEEARAGIYNCYRIPLNLVVMSIILTDLSLKSAFAICTVLMAVAVTLLVALSRSPLSSKFSKAECTDAC